MKTSLAIILCLFLFPIICCKAALTGIGDTNSIILLNKKAWKMRNTDLEAAKEFAREAIGNSNMINYPRGLSYSYNVLGHYYKVKARYDSAEIYYRKSLMIREKLRDTIMIAHSYRNLMSIDKLLGNNKRAIKTGLLAIQLLATNLSNADAARENAWLHVNLSSLYDKTGDFNQAIQFAMAGKHLFKEQEDEEGEAAAAINLGYVYESQKQYTKALEEYRFAAQSFLKSDNQRELAKAYNNMANVHCALNNFTLALSEYKKSLEIRLNNDFSEDINNSIHNIGFVYESLGKNDSALYYYNQALLSGIKSGNLERQYQSHRSMGIVFNLRREYNFALGHLLQSLTLCSGSSVLPEKILLLKEISNTYRSAGKIDSALYYSDQHVRLNDSLNAVLQNSIIMESNLKEKEYQLVISEEKNKKQIVIILCISIAFISLLVIFLMYYFSTQGKRREFRLKQIIREKELEALDAMVIGQEKERKRLAAELHDTIGSILSATKYAFKAMEDSIEKLLEENKVQYQKIGKMLDSAMESVRKISHNMAEGVITEQGLEGALRNLCETFEESGKIQFNLELHGFDNRMEYVIELNIYRILQELITNIIRHSHADKVIIQLIKNEGNINIVVEDNGRGFNPDDPNHKKGMGISNISNRVKKLSGNLNIDSGKGRGTTIVIDIPLNEEL
jgi:two-component system, NarL family, sensor kinase